MKQVTALKPIEQVRIDTDRIETLFQDLGERGAEDVVCRAMEEIAARLCEAEQDYRAARYDRMRKGCRHLVGMAEEVGMPLMARVARDVTSRIDSGDGTGLAACFARLLRIAERSLSELWDRPDSSF